MGGSQYLGRHKGFPGGTSSFIDYQTALEREIWFFNAWIPTGIYNDLMDLNNTDPFENAWDITEGLSSNYKLLPFIL